MMRKEVLARFQAEAEILFSIIKEHSDKKKNLFDYQASLLILLSNIPTTEIFRAMLKLEIVRLVDAEIQLGLLSEHKEQSPDSPTPTGTREEANNPI